MATFHFAEAEAAADFAAVMKRVRAGEEVLIQNGAETVASIRPVKPRGRSLSESIAMAEAYSKELGNKPVMDPDFADDIEEIIRNRKPADRSSWD